MCCSSSCATLFDFPFCCGVHLIHIERSIIQSKFGYQRCRSRGMSIPITFILLYIFIGIMPLYASNLDAMSLFADSSLTFLAVLNDVICNIPCFSSRCFTRWLVLCVFRPRGMLVIARRDYLSGFGPKTFISYCSFSLLSTRTEICPLFPTLLNSSQLTLLLKESSQLGTRLHCMFEALDELEECKPTLFLLLAFSSS